MPKILENKLHKIAADAKCTAKSVGLKYCVSCKKGFFKIKNKNTTYYVNENNVKVRDREILNRFAKLVLPPAWENVWISPFENGHLQATGIDAKGRKQYRYHAHWNKIRNQSKFFRIQKFAAALPSIRKQIDKDLAKKKLGYEKVLALVIKLIETTNIRVGNESYKKLYGSFGLTTMQSRHVKFNNSMVQFTFIGKKGIKHKIKVNSQKLAKLVKKCKDIPGQDLFQYYDSKGNHRTIGSADVNNYLKNITKDDFTAKDFRMWSGTVHAMEAFQLADIPEKSAQSKRKVIEVLDFVASKLGNTRTVCKKYYIHPNVIDAYERGVIWDYKSNKDKANFSASEFALVKLLEKEKIAEVLV